MGPWQIYLFISYKDNTIDKIDCSPNMTYL